ncbi:hypothetical protein PG991_016300 [Apiospora marii]|uniref:Apple domain-containing protein n=1 Tax=Apiospora marii TaxID=335849 RepID=A0ABR1QZT2_9PEZI
MRSLTTTTVAAAITFKKRQNRDHCGTANWLTTALSNGPSMLSSACSCLLTPASTTVTVTSTGVPITQTSLSTASITAIGTETATVTDTETASETTTSTASSTATIDATATESVTLTVTETKPVTAAGTTTVISTSTIFATAFVSTTVTSTVTITHSPPPAPKCADFPNPYFSPVMNPYQLSCDKVYTYDMPNLLTIVTAHSFAECVNDCDGLHGLCGYLNYDLVTKQCTLLSDWQTQEDVPLGTTVSAEAVRGTESR